MCTVHGVFLKYAAVALVAGLAASAIWVNDLLEDLPRLACFLALSHMCFVNGFMVVLFQLGAGMAILGKDAKQGGMPRWSYFVFLGFHAPSFLYTSWQHATDKFRKIPAANEVEPGWWIGGRYAVELGKTWSGIVDLTCEFPEGCRTSTQEYLLIPCWDGVPPSPALLDDAVNFALSAHAYGDVLVHCAHGRGRSTTVLCACLVKAGLHSDWESALEAIQGHRKVVKLNRAMRAVLAAWESQYMALTPTTASAKIPELVDERPLTKSGIARFAYGLFQQVVGTGEPAKSK